jgi:2-polyprenyl-3-methyl-5-hydroxy-6-metoxy-1,4-benzoquinol methylase
VGEGPLRQAMNEESERLTADRRVALCNMSKKYLYKVNVADPNQAPTKVLGLVGSNKRVLEVGCASGSQSRFLKEQLQCHVTGIEIDVDAAESARLYCEQVIVGSIESLDLPRLVTGEYDVVLFADVLEHLVEPSAALAKVAAVLADDGYVIASIPNIAHESVILDLCRGRFDYKTYGLLDSGHIRFFTKKTVYSTFENAGYVIASVDRVMHREVDTESAHVELPEAEREILEFVRKSNPESDTFQFIVKAYKGAGAAPARSHIVALEERVADLERQLSGKTERIEKLRGELAWITSRPAYRLYSQLKRLVQFKTPRSDRQ